MVLKRPPQTCWGFPVAEHEASPTPRQRRRGVAIIVAVMIISLMMVFTADMIVSSQVNLELATAARDNIVAEYLSKSGYNLALFLLSIDFGIDLFKQSQMKTPPQDGLGDIWAMVNDIPIGAETVEMLASMQEMFNLSAISRQRGHGTTSAVSRRIYPQGQRRSRQDQCQLLCGRRGDHPVQADACHAQRSVHLPD